MSFVLRCKARELKHTLEAYRLLVGGRGADRQAAEETRCPVCGGPCQYRAQEAPYHAFAVCSDPHCGHATAC